MIRNNKIKFIISSVIILIPSIVTLCLWRVLSAAMQENWHTDGFAILLSSTLLPLLVFVLFIVGMILTDREQRHMQQSQKIIDLTFWICPLVSVFASSSLYFMTFNVSSDTSRVVFIVLGVMFIVFGNYMPKARMSRTFGIKLPWTLTSEENWRKTHSFAGKLWFVGGIVTLFGVFLPIVLAPYALLTVVIALTVPTVIYSYVIYRKQVASGMASGAAYIRVGSKRNMLITLIIVAVIIVILSVFMSTGSIKAEIGEGSITLDGSFWESTEIKFEDIKTIDIEDNLKSANKVNGMSSAKLNCGWFENDELGKHIRYSYTGQDKFLVIKTEKTTFAVALESAKQTEALYNDLLAKTGRA